MPAVDRRARKRFSGSLRRFFQDEVPALTASALSATRTAIEEWRPDVVVVEQNCLAGSIAARQAGVPWISVQVTPMSLLDPFRILPGVTEWVNSCFAAPQLAAGVEPRPWPLRSPDRTIVAASATLLGPEARIEPGDVLVGSLLEHRPRSLPEGAQALFGPHPRVFASLGTAMGDTGWGFLGRAVAGLQGVAGSVVMASSWSPPDLPANVRVEPWLPQLAVLPEVDVVLCHAGQGTVNEALCHGLPLAMAPIQYDQASVAARVEALGAGLRLSFDDDGPERIREVVHRLLHTPGFAQAARRVGDSLLACGGAAAAADVVLRQAGVAE
ncbi:MAG: glycosyltransferase family 1 protein [Deltaproteobacteria bacterium]|nr:glycosyltransferase family 1 protein [Deltaproteobacteria bacterium]